MTFLTVGGVKADLHFFALRQPNYLLTSCCTYSRHKTSCYTFYLHAHSIFQSAQKEMNRGIYFRLENAMHNFKARAQLLTSIIFDTKHEKSILFSCSVNITDITMTITGNIRYKVGLLVHTSQYKHFSKSYSLAFQMIHLCIMKCSQVRLSPFQNRTKNAKGHPPVLYTVGLQSPSLYYTHN